MAKLLGFPVLWRFRRSQPRTVIAAPPPGFDPKLASHQLMFF